MSARDKRMEKRNSEHRNIEVNSGNKKAIKANKFSTNPTPPEIIDDVGAEAGAEAEAEIIPSIIIHNGVGDPNPPRQVIILPYESDELWRKPNIAYFRSSGTSNEGCGWLCGTFFPTGGITTKIKDGKKTVGIDDTCDGTEGHLLKMSDITNGATSNGIIRSISSFYAALADVLFRYFNSNTVPKNISSPTILNLFDVFNTYFLSEQQLLLSYRLSFTHSEEGLHHIGLWGWECKTFKLSDFCNTRWGNPTPINIPISINILDNTGACEFIKHYNASVNFEEMHSRIVAHNMIDGKQFRCTEINLVLHIDRIYYQAVKAKAKGIQKKNKITNKRKRKGYKRVKTIRKYGKNM